MVELTGKCLVAGHCGIHWLSRSMALIRKPYLESQRCQVLSRWVIGSMRDFGAGFVTAGDTRLRTTSVSEQTGSRESTCGTLWLVTQ